MYNNIDRKEHLNYIGLTPISEDLDNNLIVRCKNNHIFKRPYKKIFKGNFFCDKCYFENEHFKNDVKQYLPKNTICNEWYENGKDEVDFIIPDKKIAIQCSNDTYYSENNNKYKTVGVNRYKQYKEQGIDLINIYKSSWEAKKEVWVSILQNKFGNSKRIFARKCEIKEVSKLEEKEFLTKNHLQNFIGSTVAYGLYYNNELLCLMTFGKPRFNYRFDWELIRLCSKIGISVIGGPSKLFKHFLNNHTGNIMSYYDLLYSNGNVYKQLGFKFSHYSLPGYWYYKDGVRSNRQTFMKHKLKDKLKFFDPSLTESENCFVCGYYKVWDIGQGIYAYPEVVS